jgi:hypothetical protein
MATPGAALPMGGGDFDRKPFACSVIQRFLYWYQTKMTQQALSTFLFMCVYIYANHNLVYYHTACGGGGGGSGGLPRRGAAKKPKS